MAIEVGTAYISILPSTDKLAPGIKKELSGLDREADRTGKSMGSKLGSGLKKGLKVGAMGAAAVGAVGVAALGSAVKEASNLAESVNAVNVVYGKNAKGIKRLGKDAADSLGLSNTEFNNLAVQFSSFSETIAGPGGNVVKTFDELSTRGADFASVMNLDVNEAMGLFQSGLAGETEPLRKFGIDLSAAAVESYALRTGLIEAGEEMTEQEKVQARYGSLMEQTSKTQGDFANTSGSLANVQRRLGAHFDDIKAKVGSYLLPVLEDLGAWVVDHGIPALEDFGAWFKEDAMPVLRRFGGIVKDVWEDTLQPAIRKFAKWFREDAAPAIKDFWENSAKPALSALGKAVSAVWDNVLKPVLRLLWWTIRKVVAPVIEWLWKKVVKPVIGYIADWISEAWKHAIKPTFNALEEFIGKTLPNGFRRGVEAIGNIWAKLQQLAAKPVNFLIETIYNNGIRKLFNALPLGYDLPRIARVSWGSSAGPRGTGYNVGGIQAFASGGRVFGPGTETSDSILAKLSRNEFIVRAAVAKQHYGLLNYLNEKGHLPGFRDGGRVWPVPGTSIGTYAGHDGVDINRGSGWADYGDPIVAAAAGRVSYVGSGRGYGLAAFVRGAYGELVYGHMSRSAAKVGQMVAAGTLLGYVGNTGNSSAPHLHFGFPGGTYEQALAFLRGADVRGGITTGGTGQDYNKRNVLDIVRDLIGDIRSLGESGWGKVIKDAVIGAMGNVRSWINDKIWGPGPIPSFGIFDNGGVLAPGAIAYNASNKPEAVFNNRQFKQFAESAGAANRTRRVEMVITNWKTGEGYMREIADDTYNGGRAYEGTVRRMGGR